MAVAQIINDQTRKIYQNLIPTIHPSLVDKRTVASSTAPQNVKDIADYVCDGNGNDQNQLQQAIDELNNIGGGIVDLTEGVFYCSAQSGQDFCIQMKDDVVLRSIVKANTEIRKTDTNGLHVIEVPASTSGCGVAFLDINGVDFNNNTGGACLYLDADVEQSDFHNLVVRNGTAGITAVSPIECIFTDNTIIECSTAINAYNNNTRIFPTMRNTKINPNQTTAPQFGFPTARGIDIQGDNWQFFGVDMRICGVGGIIYRGNNCRVKDVTMKELFTAFEFGSGTADNFLEDVIINTNYQSAVGIIAGDDQTVKGCHVTDAGWQNNNPQPDSSTVSPFPISGDGHNIHDLYFYEIDYTYVFASNRVGVLDSTGGTNITLGTVEINANVNGNLNTTDQIARGIALTNCTDWTIRNIDMQNVNVTGLYLDNCQQTKLDGFGFENIRTGIYARNGCERTRFNRGVFVNMTNTVADMEGGDDTKFIDVDCYDTGSASAGTEDSVFYLQDDGITMREISIVQDTKGFGNVENNGITLYQSARNRLSGITIDGNESNSLSTDTQNGSAPYALGRGIYISDNGNVNKTQIDDNTSVIKCMLAGIQIGTTSENINLYNSTMTENVNDQNDSVGLQIADPSTTGENGISELRVIDCETYGNNVEYNLNGTFSGSHTYKNNRGIANDTAEYGTQLRHKANVYLSFDGSDYLRDKINVHDANQVGGGSIVQGSGNGIVGDSAVFNGTNGDYLNPGIEAFNFGASPFTWQIWFYVSNMTNDTVSLLEARGNGSQDAIGLEFEGGNQRIGMFTIVNGGAPAQVFGSTTIQASTWYHVIMKRDGNDNYFLYLNDELEAEDTSSTLATGSSLTGFACGINLPTFSGSLEGRIDEVACWFRDLHSEEITHLHNHGEGSQSLLEHDWHSRPAQGNVHMRGNKITNLGAPASAQDATSKRYVDSLAGTPPLKDQLRAYYSFDGDYKDSTSNNYDGQAVGSGSVGFSNTALIGQSVEFSGTNGDYVDLGNTTLDFGNNDFSVSCWVNFKSLSGVVWGTAVDSNNKIAIYLASDKIKLGITDGGSFNGYDTGVTLNTGQWYHLVVLREGMNYRVYLNSTLQTDVNDAIPSLGNASTIGSDFDGSLAMDGYVDEFGVWTRVLSQEEILHLYNHGNGNQYLSTYDWYAVKQSNHVDMDGHRVSNLGEALQSSDAVDKAYVDSRAPMAQLEQGARGFWALDGDYTDSINGYDGTEQGGGSLSFSNTAKIGQSLKFSSQTGDYVALGSGAFNFGSGDFTLQAWFNVKQAGSDQVITRSTDSNSTSIIGMRLYSGELTVEEKVSSGNYERYHSGVFYNPNQWYHFVFRRLNNNYQIYLDGQQILSQLSNNSPSVATTDGNQSWIGHDQALNTNCYIDEVGSWTRALTENEIKYLYHEGSGTNDFVSYDYTFNYDVDMQQHQITQLASAQTNSLTIGDDAVQSVTPQNSQGTLMAQTNTDVIIVVYDVANGSISSVGQLGSLFATSTGNLGGTTGTDGDVTISADGTNNEIDIENRSGSGTTVRILNIF